MGRLRLLEFHCRFRFCNPRRLDNEQRPGAYRDAELESAARGTAGRYPAGISSPLLWARPPAPPTR